MAAAPGLAGLLEEIVAGTSQTGQAFFESLCLCLSRALQVRYALVGELISATAVRTRGFVADGVLRPAVVYDLAGTPCEGVVGADLCHHVDGLQEAFPDDVMLRELGARSYLGVPLRAADGRTLGLLAVLHDAPIAARFEPAALLRIFAARATAELERLRTECEAGAQRERLDLALDAAHMGAWEWDAARDVVTWSERENVICGFAPGTRIGTLADYLSRMHEVDRPRLQAAVAEALATPGAPYVVEHGVTGVHGDRWIEARGKSYADATGRGWRLAGTIADVSERRRTESRLRAGEERWRRLAEASFEAVGITREGHLLDANEQLARLLDCAVDTLPGRPVLELVAPEWQATVRRRIAAPGDEPTECELLRADGQRVPVEVRVRPFALDDGPARVVVVRDLSQARRLEALLRRAAREWHECFDALPQGILVVDDDGLIRRANRASLGVARCEGFEELLGRSVASLGPGEPWTALARLLAAAGGGEEVRDASAGVTWAVSARRTQPGSGPPLTTLVFADVTETARLREALHRRDALAAIGAVIAGVAHEVRTPLFSISATLDAFDGVPPDEWGEGERLLRSQVRRLSQLMSDLLDYGRPAHLRLESTPLPEVVRRALNQCAGEAARAGVELEFESSTALPSLVCDPRRLEQAFQNLVANAVQHAPRGSSVSVALGRSGGELEVRVRDAGPGIAVADLPRVFEPFFTRRKGGTGLGLAIVERVAEAHGGRVEAHNVDGGGALFLMALPLAGPANAQREPGPPARLARLAALCP